MWLYEGFQPRRTKKSLTSPMIFRSKRHGRRECNSLGGGEAVVEWGGNGRSGGTGGRKGGNGDGSVLIMCSQPLMITLTHARSQNPRDSTTSGRVTASHSLLPHGSSGRTAFSTPPQPPSRIQQKMKNKKGFPKKKPGGGRRKIPKKTRGKSQKKGPAEKSKRNRPERPDPPAPSC